MVVQPPRDSVVSPSGLMVTCAPYTGSLLVAEARELKTRTGFTPPKWMMALDERTRTSSSALAVLPS
ncbi:hypothetical protein [Streptomyces misionensis]|uniref:hypothetical protein n=1 Tax=Streptomyces misionensis TaxID=67331 RepID=UPI00396B738C